MTAQLDRTDESKGGTAVDVPETGEPPTVRAGERIQRSPAGAPSPVLDIVVPVYDEEVTLAACVHRLHAHLTATYPYPFRITVADNASTDGTWAVALGLVDELVTSDDYLLARAADADLYAVSWTPGRRPRQRVAAFLQSVAASLSPTPAPGG